MDVASIIILICSIALLLLVVYLPLKVISWITRDVFGSFKKTYDKIRY